MAKRKRKDAPKVPEGKSWWKPEKASNASVPATSDIAAATFGQRTSTITAPDIVAVDDDLVFGPAPDDEQEAVQFDRPQESAAPSAPPPGILPTAPPPETKPLEIKAVDSQERKKTLPYVIESLVNTQAGQPPPLLPTPEQQAAEFSGAGAMLGLAIGKDSPITSLTAMAGGGMFGAPGAFGGYFVGNAIEKSLAGPQERRYNSDALKPGGPSGILEPTLAGTGITPENGEAMSHLKRIAGGIQSLVTDGVRTTPQRTRGSRL